MVKKSIIFFCLVFIVLLCYIITLYTYIPFIPVVSVKADSLERSDKLMIVAHPDDEMIWGGSHLIDDDYQVVCITCGKSPIRNKEFKEAIGETNDKFIMLGYPDKCHDKRC
jgi:hypothetical protein